MDNHVDGMSCKSEFIIEGDAYDMCSWDEMAEWLEERRQTYDCVLRS